jgi:hypothetical protein
LVPVGLYAIHIDLCMRAWRSKGAGSCIQLNNDTSITSMLADGLVPVVNGSGLSRGTYIAMQKAPA